MCLAAHGIVHGLIVSTPPISLDRLSEMQNPGHSHRHSESESEFSKK